VVNTIKKEREMSKNRKATTMVMGALKELINNHEYAYVSSSNPKFSHLEDAGKEFVIELVETVLPLLVAAQQEKTMTDAEELMLKKLSV
jgi:hypothetical protein